MHICRKLQNHWDKTVQIRCIFHMLVELVVIVLTFSRCSVQSTNPKSPVQFRGKKFSWSCRHTINHSKPWLLSWCRMSAPFGPLHYGAPLLLFPLVSQAADSEHCTALKPSGAHPPANHPSRQRDLTKYRHKVSSTIHNSIIQMEILVYKMFVQPLQKSTAWLVWESETGTLWRLSLTNFSQRYAMHIYPGDWLKTCKVSYNQSQRFRVSRYIQ